MFTQNKGIFFINLIFIAIFLALTILSGGDLSSLGVTLFFVATLLFQFFKPDFFNFSDTDKNAKKTSWKLLAFLIPFNLVLSFATNGFVFSSQFLNSALLISIVYVAVVSIMKYSERH